MLRWFITNLRTLLLALILAIAVWVSAVTAADPDETRIFPAPVPVEVVGQDPGLVLTGNQPADVLVTLRAPRSVWQALTDDPASVRVLLDLSGLDAGKHTIKPRVQVDARPVRILSISPASIQIELETLVSRTLPVDLTITGQPATGFRAGEALIEPADMLISGPESLVGRVERLRAVINLSGTRESIDQSVPVQALDKKNIPVNGLNLAAATAHITIPVSQQGGYRDVAIKVVTHGQVAQGYRLTSISVFPPVVTVFSTDPALVNAMPGAIETGTLELNGANEDISMRLALQLPDGVTAVGDSTVLVQAGVDAIQSSLTLSNIHIEVVGLPEGLAAQVSNQTVDVILSGPLPMLDTLKVENVRVIVDVTGLAAGIHQVEPKVEILLNDIQVESILPATVEIVLVPAGSVTPTATP